MEGATGITRRSVLAWSAVSAAGIGLVGCSSENPYSHTRGKVVPNGTGRTDVDKTVWSACTVNCGSRCPLRLQVKDGQVIRVLPDNTGSDKLGDQQVRACPRGRSMRQRIYNPDRLKKPMKRKPGTKRGDGEWVEISWDQALTEIAEKMTALKQQFGNECFYINYGTGVLGSTMACSWPPDQTPLARLLNIFGGYLDHYSDYSTTNITQAYPYFYGEWQATNSFDDAANAKLQVMFGNNPLETRMSGGGQTFVTQATKRKSGVKTIIIDPRYSETSVALGDEWVAIRPGTDAALIAGMLYVMVAEGLHDQKFLDKYTIGFDEKTLPKSAPAGSSYRSYLEGKGRDGVKKTPEWAADITGVPAETIRTLAREIAAAKPCAISQGWGPQRHANGENEARAVFLLAVATGNIGISGGGTGGREGGHHLPTKSIFNSEKKNPSTKIISVFSWLDAIDHGDKMDTFNAGVCEKVGPGIRANKVPVDERGNPTNIKLDVPIKAVFNYGSNSLVNQTGDNNKSVDILRDDTKAELIVTCDIMYTVSARYSDYLLPGTSTAEESDFHQGENAAPMAYGIVSEQAIDPLFECRSIFDICTALAEKLGVKDEYTGGKTREQWLESVIDEGRKVDPTLPTYAEWKKQGIVRRNMGSIIPMKDFRDDPAGHPLPTPSGKIEIYSERLAKLGEKWTFGDFRPKLAGDILTPLPEFVAAREGALEARTNDKYPLQVIGHHFKARTHSSYGNVEWLKQAHRQTVWMNPIDAKARGIANDDEVFVYNERGTIRLPAKVTTRIAPGVLSVPQGAWYSPKPASEVAPPQGANPDKPVDVAGSMNTLTSLHPTPLAKGMGVHTVLAQAEKA